MKKNGNKTLLRKVCEDLLGKPESHGNNTLGNDRLHYVGSLSYCVSFLIHILARHIKHSNYLASCHTCKRSKYQVFSPEGLFQVQPLPTSNDIREDIDIDFIVSLPKSKGFDAILVLVVVNRFGKYGNFILIQHLYSARSIVEMFAKKAVKLHTSVVSDREPTYFSHFWKEFFRTEGTGLMMNTPYHPEYDGKAEVLNRTLETYLRCFSSEQQNTWTVLYHWDEQWWNIGNQGAVKCTTFEIVYSSHICF